MNIAQLIYETNKHLFDPNLIKKLAIIDNDLKQSLAFGRYFDEVCEDRHEIQAEVIQAQGRDLAAEIDEARATISQALRRLAPRMIEDVREGRQDWDQLRDLLGDHPEVREEVENYL